MLNALLGTPDFPFIFEALELALKGDGSAFALAAGDPIPSVQDVVAMPLLCSDYREYANWPCRLIANFHGLRH